MEFNGVKYPFYRTIRGSYDFENAGFETKDMAAGKIPAMFGYIYFQLRDCAKRAAIPFNYTLDQFIDQATGEELEVYGRLVAEEKRINAEEVSEPGKPQTEEAGAK